MKRTLILAAIVLMSVSCKPSRGDIFEVDGDLYCSHDSIWTVYDKRSKTAFDIVNPPREAEDRADNFRVKMRLRVLSAGPDAFERWLAEITHVYSIEKADYQNKK